MELPQKITYWKKTANDGYGGFTWSAPVSPDARIANKTERFMNEEGRELISKKVVYCRDSNITPGSVFVEGESTDATPPASTEEVKAVASNSSYTDMVKLWV